MQLVVCLFIIPPRLIRRLQMDVVVVGSCNTDLISYVPRLPRAGETIHGSSFRSGFGGKGANQCVMAARLGARAAMVAKVGDDRFGHDTIQNFKDNNVHCEHVKITEETHSGVAPITVNEDGENSIVIVSGANMKLTSQDVLDATDLIMGSKVMVCQLEVQPETTLEALRLAKKHGVLTIFNTSPAAVISDIFYQNTDILTINETEAEVLTGHAVVDVASAILAVKTLQSRGPGCVVLTLGAKGVVFSSQESPNTVSHIPAEPVLTLDTTGAGDAFVGAMAYYLACQSHLPFSEVIRRSGVIASTTTKYPGTQSSYLVNQLPQYLIN